LWCDGFCNIKAARHKKSQKELAKTRLLKLSKTSHTVCDHFLKCQFFGNFWYRISFFAFISENMRFWDKLSLICDQFWKCNFFGSFWYGFSFPLISVNMRFGDKLTLICDHFIKFHYIGGFLRGFLIRNFVYSCFSKKEIYLN
jgi:hypothetical protein